MNGVLQEGCQLNPLEALAESGYVDAITREREGRNAGGDSYLRLSSVAGTVYG